MNKRPYMPLYIADYAVDTAHLTAEQHGAYLLLLMAMWNARGWLPNNRDALIRIARVAPTRWSHVSRVVLPFFQVERDRLTHKRITAELRKARRIQGAQPTDLNQDSKSAQTSSSLLTPSLKTLDNQELIKSVIRKADQISSEAKPLKNGHIAEGLARAGVRARVPRDRDLSQTSDIEDPNGSSLAHENVRRTRKPGDAEFQIWWDRYPVKRGKGQAERAFHAARKIASLDELLDGVARYRREKLPDRAWRYPATWLNGKGWLDEPEPEPAVQRRSSPGPPQQEWRDAAERERQEASAYLRRKAQGG